jgi:uncharacterized membrane-anchored protein
VTIRSMSLILVFGVLGVGVLNLLVNPGYRNVGWARQVARRPVVVAAAILAIVIAVVLERSVLVVPGKSLWLQPSLQAFISLIVAVVIYALAHIRAIRNGQPIAMVAREAPPE